MAYLTSSILITLATFLISVLLSKYASEKEFFKFNLYQPLILGLSHIFLFGQAAGITTAIFGPKYKLTNKSKLLATSLITIFFVFLIASLILVVFSRNYEYLQKKYLDLDNLELILCMIAALGLALRDFSLNYFQITKNYKSLIYYSILIAVVVISILLIFPSFKGFLFSSSLFFIIFILFFAVQFTKHSKNEFNFSFKLNKILFKEGWPTIPSVFLLNLVLFFQRDLFKTNISLIEFNAFIFFFSISSSFFKSFFSAYFRKENIEFFEFINGGKIFEAKRISKKLAIIILIISFTIAIINKLLGNVIFSLILDNNISSFFWIISVFVPITASTLYLNLHGSFFQLDGKILKLTLLSLLSPVLVLFLLLISKSTDISLTSLCYIFILSSFISNIIFTLYLSKYLKNNFVSYFLVISLTFLSLIFV